MMRIHLKVKCATLAQEQRIIRRYLRSLAKRGAMKERKQVDGRWQGGTPNMRSAFTSMYEHSKKELAPEARHSQLAYGFLRKRPYTVMERACRKLPDWDRIEKIALRFGSVDGVIDERLIKQSFAAWKDASASHAEHERRNLLAKDRAAATVRKKRYAANNTEGARAARRQHYAPIVGET